ncbi:hypothetical protein [Ramlibacter sp. PS4R-6]|uniref:hypothetical protein n=1 Tax=Ramlibacter sp. PS4R-6 TaxID=3133438 RepID=UPI00309BBF54
MIRTPTAAILCAGAAALLSTSGAFAAKPSPAQLRYQQERADCLSGASSQDRATCLREAAAALQEARRGNLSTGDLAQNGVARCNALPADDRQDCVLRMQPGAASGSVSGGGVLRESTRPAER